MRPRVVDRRGIEGDVLSLGLKPGAAPPGCGAAVWVKDVWVVNAKGSPWSLPSVAA